MSDWSDIRDSASLTDADAIRASLRAKADARERALNSFYLRMETELASIAKQKSTRTKRQRAVKRLPKGQWRIYLMCEGKRTRKATCRSLASAKRSMKRIADKLVADGIDSLAWLTLVGPNTVDTRFERVHVRVQLKDVARYAFEKKHSLLPTYVRVHTGPISRTDRHKDLRFGLQA